MCQTSRRMRTKTTTVATRRARPQEVPRVSQSENSSAVTFCLRAPEPIGDPLASSGALVQGVFLSFDPCAEHGVAECTGASHGHLGPLGCNGVVGTTVDGENRNLRGLLWKRIRRQTPPQALSR